MEDKEYFFKVAFAEAKKALRKGEVPVGAVIVKNGKIISKAYNSKEKNQCALFHAEIKAIKKASQKINNWRLIDCDIYVTLEPCEMCAAAIKQARIKNIFSAISNDDINIHSSVVNILSKDKSNPQVNLYNNLEIQKGKKILKDFFIATRNN